MPATTIPMTPCESSQIASYGYDAGRNVLAVAFKRGAKDVAYEYDAVPPGVFAQLEAAESKGSFVHKAIVKGGFSYRKMDPAATEA